MDIHEMAERDQRNAELIRASAEKKRQQPPTVIDKVVGARNRSDVQHAINEWHREYDRVVDAPFDAMVEYDAMHEQSDPPISNTLVYLHTNITSAQQHEGLLVLPWTNAVAQLALSNAIGEAVAVPRPPRRASLGYSPRRQPRPVAAVVPRHRVKRYLSILPELVATYEPHGDFPKTIAPPTRKKRRSGLLSDVKLGMTPEQVNAFISVPTGYLLITGAPGTGKTTVALQRIRFLSNEYSTREDRQLDHSIAATAVFVPNIAFVTHVQRLLDELQLPPDLVVVADDYIRDYLDALWTPRLRAHEQPLPDARDWRGRQAFFGLCQAGDLTGLWKVYEAQIRERVQNSDVRWFNELTTFANLLAELQTTDEVKWHRTYRDLDHNKLREATQKLAQVLATPPKTFDGGGPDSSFFTMQALYDRCGKEYKELRQMLSDHAESECGRFDNAFRSWLFWVYDPLCAIASYFRAHLDEGRERIAEGLGDDEAASRIVAQLDSEFGAVLSAERDLPKLANQRSYGAEQRAWIAWLLRNALPEHPDSKRRFATIPRAFFDPTTRRDRPWHHIVVDEAQDLSVAGAALISSLVRNSGAMTVSADFRQVVSPVCGIDDDTVMIGSSRMKAVSAERSVLPVNMRQSGQIGRFVAAFFEAVFGTDAPFDVLPMDGEPIPRVALVHGPRAMDSVILSEINTLRAQVDGAIAVIEVNGDMDSLHRLSQLLGPASTMLFSEYLAVISRQVISAL